MGDDQTTIRAQESNFACCGRSFRPKGRGLNQQGKLININIESLPDTFISLTTAFILGAIERQYRQRTAGLPTNVLVTVSYGQ
jgi:hypothetical protein